MPKKGTTTKYKRRAGVNIGDLKKEGYAFDPPIPEDQFGGDIYTLRQFKLEHKPDGTGRKKQMKGVLKNLETGRLYLADGDRYREFTDDEYSYIVKEVGERVPEPANADEGKRVGRDYKQRTKDAGEIVEVDESLKIEDDFEESEDITDDDDEPTITVQKLYGYPVPIYRSQTLEKFLLPAFSDPKGQYEGAKQQELYDPNDEERGRVIGYYTSIREGSDPSDVMIPFPTTLENSTGVDFFDPEFEKYNKKTYEVRDVDGFGQAYVALTDDDGEIGSVWKKSKIEKKWDGGDRYPFIDPDGRIGADGKYVSRDDDYFSDGLYFSQLTHYILNETYRNQNREDGSYWQLQMKQTQGADLEDIWVYVDANQKDVSKGYLMFAGNGGVIEKDHPTLEEGTIVGNADTKAEKKEIMDFPESIRYIPLNYPNPPSSQGGSVGLTAFSDFYWTKESELIGVEYNAEITIKQYDEQKRGEVGGEGRKDEFPDDYIIDAEFYHQFYPALDLAGINKLYFENFERRVEDIMWCLTQPTIRAPPDDPETNLPDVDGEQDYDGVFISEEDRFYLEEPDGTEYSTTGLRAMIGHRRVHIVSHGAMGSDEVRVYSFPDKDDLGDLDDYVITERDIGGGDGQKEWADERAEWLGYEYDSGLVNAEGKVGIFTVPFRSERVARKIAKALLEDDPPRGEFVPNKPGEATADEESKVAYIESLLDLDESAKETLDLLLDEILKEDVSENLLEEKARIESKKEKPKPKMGKVKASTVVYGEKSTIKKKKKAKPRTPAQLAALAKMREGKKKKKEEEGKE